ncbi:MAG: ABC transporter permease [Proteobacteria bacterium]|nr:ABC transporter permease [Pseudomonadota bacterium]
MIGRIYLALVYLFIVGPAAMIVVDSFNAATSFPSPFESPTLRWYLAIWAHDEFLRSIRTSTIVALAAAAIATGLALPAAYALVRHPLRGGNIVATLFVGPLLVPQIVMGLAMLQLLGLAGVDLGLGGLIAVHAVYVMPFTVRLIMTSLARFDFTLAEAARTLGAGRLATLRRVTLPLIRTGLVAGFTFAFILSFVNLPLSLFLTTPRTATLPIEMFAYMESRIDPLVAAIGALVLIAAVAFTVTLERVFRLRLAG